MVRRSFILFAVVCAVWAGTSHGLSQSTAAAPVNQTPTSPLAPPDETPQQRLERLGTQEDPGPDPDPKKRFIRFGKEYTIEKFVKKNAKYDQEKGWVRPLWAVNIRKEIYQENDEYVWVWMEVPQLIEVLDTEVSVPREYRPEEIEYYNKVRDEFREVTPEASPVTLEFQESSEGLPMAGSWRNSLDVADMNEDGFVDIVAPPQRGAIVGVPVIFLGNGKGQWTVWTAARFPRGGNYGSVSVADFNKDGHMDIAMGVHLMGVVVFLGDGKGQFTNSSKGLPGDFPTRRVLVEDVDRDSWPDIVTISEGPTTSSEVHSSTYSKLRVYLNRDGAKLWKEIQVAEPNHYTGGDWLGVGDFNADKRPDFATASIYFSGPDVLYLSAGPAKWSPVGRDFLPYFSYYFALTTGKFSSKSRDDAILSFARAWPSEVDPAKVEAPPIDRIVGIERVSWTSKKPVRKVIAAWKSQRGIWGLAKGDFDGDKHMDIVYADADDPRKFVVLLGDGKGNFRKAAVKGLDVPQNVTYDIKVADVDLDGRPDILTMFESTETVTEKNGSIRVWLNRTSGSFQGRKAPAPAGKKIACPERGLRYNPPSIAQTYVLIP